MQFARTNANLCTLTWIKVYGPMIVVREGRQQLLYLDKMRKIYSSFDFSDLKSWPSNYYLLSYIPGLIYCDNIVDYHEFEFLMSQLQIV